MIIRKRKRRVPLFWFFFPYLVSIEFTLVGKGKEKDDFFANLCFWLFWKQCGLPDLCGGWLWDLASIAFTPFSDSHEDIDYSSLYSLSLLLWYSFLFRDFCFSPLTLSFFLLFTYCCVYNSSVILWLMFYATLSLSQQYIFHSDIFPWNLGTLCGERVEQ